MSENARVWLLTVIGVVAITVCYAAFTVAAARAHKQRQREMAGISTPVRIKVWNVKTGETLFIGAPYVDGYLTITQTMGEPKRMQCDVPDLSAHLQTGPSPMPYLQPPSHSMP